MPMVVCCALFVVGPGGELVATPHAVAGPAGRGEGPRTESVRGPSRSGVRPGRTRPGRGGRGAVSLARRRESVIVPEDGLADTPSAVPRCGGGLRRTPTRLLARAP